MSQVAGTGDETGSTFDGCPTRGTAHDGVSTRRSSDEVMAGARREPETSREITPSSTGRKLRRRRTRKPPSSKRRSRRRLLEYVRRSTGIPQPILGSVESSLDTAATPEVVREDDYWKESTKKKKRKRRRCRAINRRSATEATTQSNQRQAPDEPDSTADHDEYGVEEVPDSTLREQKETMKGQVSQIQHEDDGQRSTDVRNTRGSDREVQKRKDETEPEATPLSIYEKAKLILKSMTTSPVTEDVLTSTSEEISEKKPVLDTAAIAVMDRRKKDLEVQLSVLNTDMEEVLPEMQKLDQERQEIDWMKWQAVKRKNPEARYAGGFNGKKWVPHVGWCKEWHDDPDY